MLILLLNLVSLVLKSLNTPIVARASGGGGEGQAAEHLGTIAPGWHKRSPNISRVISLQLEGGFMTMGHATSWYRIALAITGSLNESLIVYMVGFWPVWVFGTLLVSLGNDSRLHSIALSIHTMACLNIVLLNFWCCSSNCYTEGHAVIMITSPGHPCEKREAGVMAVVTKSGTVRPGMDILIEPTFWFKKLQVLIEREYLDTGRTAPRPR